MKNKKWILYAVGLFLIFLSLIFIQKALILEDATWHKLFALVGVTLAASLGCSFIFNTKQYALNTARIFSGILFIFSGFVKAVDPLGSKYKFIDYFHAWGLDFLDPTALTFGIILSTIELVVGLALLFKIYPKLSSIIALIFMVGFTPVTLYLALQENITGAELVHDCGCFGDALILTNWQTFVKNIIILIPVISIFLYRNSLHAIVAKLQSIVTIAAFTVITIILSVYSLRHLPPIDFRPYKIGTKLINRNCSDIVEESSTKTYMYAQFSHIETGEKKEFEITENYPDYNLWQYDTSVAIRNEIVKLHTQSDANISNTQNTFVVDNLLFTKGGQDFTCNIISDTSFVLLIVQYDVVHTNIKPQKKINELYEWAKSKNFAFYAASSSLNEQIETYKLTHNIEYEYIDADDIPLKTIVRANPGLVLLKDGVVLNNWHGNDIPTIEYFEQITK